MQLGFVRFVIAFASISFLGEGAVQSAESPMRRYILGKQLNQYCTLDETNAEMRVGRAMCQTYVLGVVDTHETMAFLGLVKRQFCLPEGTFNATLTDTAASWVKRNPDKHDMTASLLVLTSLKEKFPCAAKLK
jgi:hypothetical protein